jgi:uncharacterized membrane protein
MEDDRATDEGAPSRPLLVFVAVLLALGVFFRFYHLDHKVYWDDELNGTLRIVGTTEAQIVTASAGLTDAAGVVRFLQLPRGPGSSDRLGNTVASLAAEDPQHPPLYYLLGHLWAELFGTSATALRSLSAIFGVLALPCMYWLCRELLGSRTAAWLGSGLMAVAPFHVLYAQEAREYSLWTVGVLLMSASFLRALRTATPAAWALYAAASAFALYVFPLSGLVLVADGVYVALMPDGRTRRALLGYAVAALAAVAAFLPWLLVMLRSRAQIDRGMAGILTDRVSTLRLLAGLARDLRTPFIDLGARFGPVHLSAVNGLLSLAVIAAVAYAWYVLARAKQTRILGFIAIGLCLPVLPLLVRDLLLHGRLVDQPRYLVPLYLGLEVSLTALLAMKLAGPPRERAWGRAGVAVLAACGIVSCAISSQAQTWWTKSYEQNRRAATAVNSAWSPVVVSDNHTTYILALAYYLRPDVPVLLDLHCYLCTVAPPAPRLLLARAATHGTIYLLGPSDDLIAQVPRGQPIDFFARYRVIEVRAFHWSRLGLFVLP